MYLVNIINDGVKSEIHGYKQKLSSGSVVKGINAIDSFSFAMNPKNYGFNRLQDFKTLVEVYNTNKNRFEFQGRVLYQSDEMADSGALKKTATCESFFGYLCDSVQEYVEEKNWTVEALVTHILTVHNEQVEEEKRFYLGELTVTDKNDNVYIGIQRENTFETLSKKLVEKLGGEIRFRVVDGKIYLDYLEEIGEHKETPISLSRNMKSIVREKNPTAFVTRLIPLGAKLADDSEERLDISSVNNGVKYIDDAQAIEKYGVHVGVIEFDEVTDAGNLKTKGEEWLKANNKVQVKYSITALDLSLLGLVIDDFEVHNYHPIINPLLEIVDEARIIKKNIDICEEIKSTFEIGDNFKTLSDIQKEQYAKIIKVTGEVSKTNTDIKGLYAALNSKASTDYVNSEIEKIELTPGKDGADGKSAYEIWLERGNEGSESDFLQSLKGEKGEQGTGVNVKASADDCTEIGDAYIDGDGNIQIVTSLSPLEFTNGGQVKGEKGDAGANGKDGYTPYIQDGNWYINGSDTGVKAQGLDGADGQDGQDGKDGADGYTPVKGVDYFDGKDGANGKDGYTPVKGIDYFDGKDGYTPVKGVDYFDGEKGEKGEQGVQGEKGDKGDKGDKGEQGIQGETGATGATGAKGEQGERGLQGERGEAGQDGKDGEKGEQGEKGDDGKSAYQIWLENGHEGTETDFLNWLKGEKGDKGDKGEQGEQGEQGVQGETGANGQDGQDGADGKSAYEIWLENGNTGTETDFLASLKGEDGQDVDPATVENLETAINGKVSQEDYNETVAAVAEFLTPIELNKNSTYEECLAAFEAVCDDGRTVLYHIENADYLGTLSLSGGYAAGENNEIVGYMTEICHVGADIYRGGFKIIPNTETVEHIFELVADIDGFQGALEYIATEIEKKASTEYVDEQISQVQGVQGEKGDKGEQGSAGRGIAYIEYANGNFTVTYTDGTSSEIEVGNADPPYYDYAEGLLVTGTLPLGTTLDIGETFGDITDIQGIAVSGFAQQEGLIAIRVDVPTISAYAFEDCTNLATVTLTGNVTGIGAGAFRGTTAGHTRETAIVCEEYANTFIYRVTELNASKHLTIDSDAFDTTPIYFSCNGVLVAWDGSTVDYA